MIYSLFTEIALENKMRLSAQSKSGLERFDPDLIVVFCKLVVALGATTKSH